MITLSAEDSEYRWLAWDEIPDLAFTDVRDAVRDLVGDVTA
ncbi:hypothetical protein [Kutzneria kofuensis]|uniref:Uncharacterized protein n=1 Tax=Kutzneria kofuensis TaxID=103725 RepID=A0A7W9KKR3_9PSEU|nr:hypothetical protein [Kutzneria kofuensis]MBB5894388.1 hypothetical protein [Kutzneria kofuensis]